MPQTTTGIRSRFSVAGITALTIAALFTAGCGEKVKPGTAEVQRQVVQGVTLLELKPSQVDEYYETSGTVKAKQTGILSSRVMGTVTALHVKEGDRVSAGQVLMAIDDRDAAARVEAADAGQSEAQKALEAAGQSRSLVDLTYGRYKKLHDGKAISRQEMDEIETRKKVSEIEYQRAEEAVKRAKAGLREAQVNRGFSRIRAPFPGVVTAKTIDTGSMAVPGSPLITVEDTSLFRIEVNADERLSGKVSPGMAVDVVIESTGMAMQGKVSEVVPAVDPMTRTFLIKIDLRGAGLRSGLFGRVSIPEGKKEAILVPQKAIVRKGELTGVYLADDKGIITYRLIRAGKERNGMVEVLSGTHAGEKAVVDGVEKAVDGGVLQAAGK
ncbi:MAG: efflux RND transporter periplasmic adaptor subunit [Thermodesulfovibrionales bacterium]